MEKQREDLEEQKAIHRRNQHWAKRSYEQSVEQHLNLISLHFREESVVKRRRSCEATCVAFERIVSLCHFIVSLTHSSYDSLTYSPTHSVKSPPNTGKIRDRGSSLRRVDHVLNLYVRACDETEHEKELDRMRAEYELKIQRVESEIQVERNRSERRREDSFSNGGLSHLEKLCVLEDSFERRLRDKELQQTIGLGLVCRQNADAVTRAENSSIHSLEMNGEMAETVPQILRIRNWVSIRIIFVCFGIETILTIQI